MERISPVHEQVRRFIRLNLKKVFFAYIATQYYQADTKTHRYSSVGTYIVTVMATGPYNTVTKSFSVDVQYPVTSFNVNYSTSAGSSAHVSYSGSKNH
jgi:hypothetical protein